jgi:non-ribosomal peptide synthetase component F
MSEVPLGCAPDGSLGAPLGATSLDDETIWSLSGARVDAPFPDAEAFCSASLLDLLRAGATHDPAAIALVNEAASLRYDEMLRLANRVACVVAGLVPPNRSIACLLPRTPQAMAGLLGCLLSGRLCMVMDPAHPIQRQEAVLLDAAPYALLLAEPVPFPFAGPVLLLRDALAVPVDEGDWVPDWNPDAPFVVYFTFGSSGRPKGIVLSARSVFYRALEIVHRGKLTPADCLFAPDIHVAGSGLSILIGVLAQGARVLLTDIAREGAGAVLRLIQRETVTCAVIHPPMMRLLFQLERAPLAFSALRYLRMGASGLSRMELASWRALLPSDCMIWHNYASTEALFLAAWCPPADDPGHEATVAVGMLQPSHDYALLAEDGSPVACGEPGELVLRTRYVALGEWVGGRMVPGRMPPVPGCPGWRFYRTGDVLRVQPDGYLRMLGRADRQVKINGIRVEPAEIEAIIRAQPGVSDAVVVAESTSAGVTLHGLVEAANTDRTALIAALRKRLAAALPMALRPSRLTVLDRLPMLPSGKIDLAALSRITQSHTNNLPNE